MASLSDLSDELSALVERAEKSVVRVDARRGRAGSGTAWGEDLVLTANHVIEDEEHIEVRAGGATLRAAVAGRDPGTDLALLRAEGLGLPAAPRGRVAELKVGHLVLALARPGELHATLGLVSALSATFRSWRGAEIDRLIQTTAQLLPGFSGGPLVDAEGGVVGINSWHLGRGVSRSIPVDVAERVAESLRLHGRIRRGYLGLGTQPVRLPEATQRRLGQESGLLVVTVEPQGPAGKAGVMQGDTVIALNGMPIRHLDDLFAALRTAEVGSSQTLRIVRAGETRELPVTVGERAG